MHSLVPAEIGELRVGLVADLALEGLDTRMDVSVLLQSARSREGLAALTASVGPGAFVVSSNVALEVAGVCEVAVAVVAQKSPVLVLVRHTGRFAAMEGLGILRTTSENNKNKIAKKYKTNDPKKIYRIL